MFIKHTLAVLFLFFSLFSFSKAETGPSNVGFIPSNIWYSKDPFVEGDNIKIYTFIFNPDLRKLSGTVEFFDNTILLGKKDFTVETKGVKDISIDWTVSAGDHKIFGKIINAKFLTSAGKYEEADLSESETQKSTRTVSKKITSGNTEENKSGDSSVDNITKIVQEKTPGFVSKPLVSAINSLEEVRATGNKMSEDKRESVKEEIKSFDRSPPDPEDENNINKDTEQKDKKNPLSKPFKYVELFFFTLCYWIFHEKIIFYGLLLLVIFFMLRFLWRIFF